MSFGTYGTLPLSKEHTIEWTFVMVCVFISAIVAVCSFCVICISTAIGRSIATRNRTFNSDLLMKNTLTEEDSPSASDDYLMESGTGKKVSFRLSLNTIIEPA
ncbi:hypothetical protein QR680_015767 [Steinernema hermaphroditum]|uniref:Uncharacterized protein n=1 Tax=Steinernema hermaphroditum TaxID=289476 RepID=A0AA39H8W4_9BILA|nr:hypothetical protein QR680_015767 [Steinernema hermaphroditum]